jgi:hypothetical protein
MTEDRTEIPEIEIFALLGQKDCEIFMKDKIIEQLKKKLADTEPIRQQNLALLESNKSLNEQCIALDKQLTDARLELSQTFTEIEGLNVKHNKNKKRDEINVTNT